MKIGPDTVTILARRGRVFVDANLFSHLTPAEARRVAAALVREAEKAEKKGKKK